MRKNDHLVIRSNFTLAYKTISFFVLTFFSSTILSALHESSEAFWHIRKVSSHNSVHQALDCWGLTLRWKEKG